MHDEISMALEAARASTVAGLFDECNRSQVETGKEEQSEERLGKFNWAPLVTSEQEALEEHDRRHAIDGDVKEEFQRSTVLPPHSSFHCLDCDEGTCENLEKNRYDD